MKSSSAVTALSLLTLVTGAAAQQAPALPKDVLEQVVQDWARSWESRNPASYFGHYHTMFTPVNVESRQSWREQRTVRVTTPASIEIEICKLEVTQTYYGGTGIRFWMDYQSPTYADSTLKEMVIGPDEDGKLRILRENNLEVRRRSTDAAAGTCPLPIAAAGLGTTAVATPPQSTSPVIAAQALPQPPAAPVQDTGRSNAVANPPVQPPAQPVNTGAAVMSRQPRNYAGVHAGINDLEDWKGKVALGKNIELDGSLSLDSNWTAGLVLGREYENSRYEVEYQQGSYSISAISLGTQHSTTDSSGKYQALTANAYRVQHFAHRVDGYLGLGIGMGRASLPALGFQNACQCFASADESGFVWQWRIGLEYALSENNRLSLQWSGLRNVPGPVSGGGFPAVTYEDKNLSTLSLQWRAYVR